MELTQPAASDSEFLRLDNANKKHSFKKHAKNKGKFLMSEGQSGSKSLRSDWEKTLAKKENHTLTDKESREGVFKFNETSEKEIHLHIDAEEIQGRVQPVDKPDPRWESWQPKKPEVTSVKPEEVVTPLEQVLAVEEEPATVVSIDPSLSAEALLHSKAVANIAEEHAQRATPPSYKDQLPKEAQEIMERLQPARDHHIEQSTWHNIEVDNKTGKAVEEPTFSYGEAFKDEQRTETNAFHTDDGVISASGQLAVSTPTFNNLNDKDAAILSNAQPSPNPLPTSQIQTPYPMRGRSSVDPLLWTVLTVIVMAIFLALFI